MNDDARSGAAGSPEPSVSRRTWLLRAAADGQLTPEESEELKAHLRAHPEDEAMIAFERELARETAAAFEPAPSSAGAEARVRLLLARRMPPSPIVRGWRGPVRWLAAAAVIGGLAITATLLVEQREHRARQAASATLVAFLAQHQIDCETGTPMSAMELSTTSLADVPAALRGVLGSEPRIADLASIGLAFRGAGPCKLPGDPSMHLLFQSADRAHAETVSVFLQRDSDLVPKGENAAYVFSEAKDAAESLRIVAWRADGFVHFLVSRQEPAFEAARAALDVPSAVVSI